MLMFETKLTSTDAMQQFIQTHRMTLFQLLRVKAVNVSIKVKIIEKDLKKKKKD